ncbi:MAG: hypothetical protein ACUZ8O_09175 [Candidatus Anammoxibacter sp.]
MPNNVSAQHIDVFNIDFDKKNKKNKNKNKETGFIEVVEHTKYKVAIEKEKLEKNDFSVYDLELIEIPAEDLSRFAWHTVEVFTEKEIEQTQTREAGDLKCTRSRKGTMYWLSNGKKHVNWGIWTFWKCTKGEKN